MIYKYLIAVFLMSIPVILPAQKKVEFDCPPVKTYTDDQMVFKSGERLTVVAGYKWGLINADVGEATMSIEEEMFRDTHYYSVRAYATTYKMWDRFFVVRDVYESHFDFRTLRPIYFHRNVNEGGYKILGTMYFNDDYTIKSSTVRNEKSRKDTVLSGRSCTYDLISLFYSSRSLDFTNLLSGKTYPFSFAIDDEIYNLSYSFIAREEIKISGLGTFRALHFTAQLVIGDVFSGESDMDIWITDDANRMPLMVKTALRVGTVSVRLSKYDNLKYPLTSKIK